LTAYHHPERIPVLARERGPNFTKTANLPTAATPAGDGAAKQADTKLWAAYVLAGLGR
jgi:hypothetical protein